MIDLNRNTFNEANTYSSYNQANIFKTDSNNIKSLLEQIDKINTNEKILIELQNTIGLTDEIIDIIPNNVDIRIIGSRTEEFAKSSKNQNMDYLREKATYSKKELKEIMNKIQQIEANINSNWNDYEKALYLYEYLKADIVYRTPIDKDDNGMPLDKNGNANRARNWDTLTGLTTQLSTCSGFSHIYQELCTRQGIKCVAVAGKYNKGTSHAWNIITINNNNFLVDMIFDAQEYEKGNDQTTRFCINDTSKYSPRCYIEQHFHLASIDPEWINKTKEKISINIPKQQMANEKINQFLHFREQDKQRMKYLRKQQIENANLISEKSINGGITK